MQSDGMQQRTAAGHMTPTTARTEETRRKLAEQNRDRAALHSQGAVGTGYVDKVLPHRGDSCGRVKMLGRISIGGTCLLCQEKIRHALT